MCTVLVEDEALILMLVSELLTDAGHIVKEFGTAAGARAYCDVAEDEITTVSIDINMPGKKMASI